MLKLTCHSGSHYLHVQVSFRKTINPQIPLTVLCVICDTQEGAEWSNNAKIQQIISSHDKTVKMGLYSLVISLTLSPSVKKTFSDRNMK